MKEVFNEKTQPNSVFVKQTVKNIGVWTPIYLIMNRTRLPLKSQLKTNMLD